MILKLIGTVIIVFTCSKIGFDFASALSRRVEQLQDLKLGLSALQIEITFRNMPLAEALQKSAMTMHTQARELLIRVSHLLQSEEIITAKDAFRKAIEEYKEVAPLKESDYAVLKGFAGLIGTSDLAGQTANIENTKIKYDHLIHEAEEYRNKYEKLYRSSGVLIGLLITVLFI